MQRIILALLLAATTFTQACAQKEHATTSKHEKKDTRPTPVTEKKIITGAAQLKEYLPALKNKRVGLLANQTSLIDSTHLLDVLLAEKINVTKIFMPEHGFRGTADAGESIKSGIDVKTGIPLVSLYDDKGKKAPSATQMQDLDAVVFDIQDVGARFYTYISAMHNMMQSCAERGIPLVILDRPNPNGFYVDGPVLDPKFKSYVGMHPIPIVHGLTVAELAQMINGEGWLKDAKKCDLHIVKMQNYTHQSRYTLPVKPSPNLPNDVAINLYPSLCLFEGTIMSVGRGTPFPFQAIGAPKPAYGNFTFTPVSTPGGAKYPLYENQQCHGVDLRNSPESGFSVKYVIDMYQKSPEKDKFFNNFFNNLAGNSSLQAMIKQGSSEEEIRKTWEPALSEYKAKRKKYLLYAE